MDTQSLPSRQLPILTPLLMTLMLVGASANVQGTQTNPGAQTDLRSIDSLLKVFYGSLSFPEGKSPDWDRFRTLFAFAASPCIRIAGDSVMQMDRESFIAFFNGRIKRGTLRSFEEKEIARGAIYSTSHFSPTLLQPRPYQSRFILALTRLFKSATRSQFGDPRLPTA